jgi:hypothetical protein
VGIFEVKVFSFMLNAKNNTVVLIARIIVVVIIIPALHGGGFS